MVLNGHMVRVWGARTYYTFFMNKVSFLFPSLGVLTVGRIYDKITKILSSSGVHSKS